VGVSPQTSEPTPYAVWARDFTSATVALGEHLLSVPWKDNTIKARQLLLATSVGGLLVLMGVKPMSDSLWQQIREASGPDVLLWFVTLLVLYALVAYFLASSNDRRRYELLTLHRTTEYKTQLASLADARAQLDARLHGSDAPPADIADARLALESATSRIRDLESAMTDSASRSAIAELRNVMARRDQLEARVDKWQREQQASVTNAVRGLLNYAHAPETIDITTDDLFSKAKRSYRFQTWFEQWGALLFGSAVLLRLLLRIVVS